MPAIKRNRTKYPGVFYIDGVSPATGRPERIYYIRYRKAGKMIEEKAGRQWADGMTPARAAAMRAERMQGKAPTRREAREQQEAARKAAAERYTISRLWEEYKARHPDLKGLVTDENRFQNHLRPFFGDREPKSLTPFDVDRLRLTLLKKRKPGTVKNTLELLRRLINFGIKQRLCDGPAFTITMPRVNNVKTEDLSPDQLAALLEAMEADLNVQAKNLMKLALLTGMRRGELFRLQWGDLDFERGFIYIRNPKGGVDQKIPMNPAARELLMAHPRTDSLYVFPGRGGRQRTDIKKQVNRIKEAAGLPADFRALHGLRHVYASMLASSGQVDLYTLQKLLTHKSAAMTQRYAHLRDEALKRAANLASELVGQVANSRNHSDKAQEA